MRENPVQFAVVREDPRVEQAVLADRGVENGLLVASGGCTAFHLHGLWPDGRWTLIDPNQSQLDLVARKIEALQGGDRQRFNIGDDDPMQLSQCGNFESLFRSLRRFVEEFVAEPAEIASWFDASTPRAQVAAIFERSYWRVGFGLFFADALLEEMFGPDATQHAHPGSYPDYFRLRIEQGLTAPDASSNYFLHHIFLGCYRSDALPSFLRESSTRYRFDLQQHTFDSVPDLQRFDFVNLSNIMDWMSAEQIGSMAERLCRDLRPGSLLMWRQLNNDADHERVFGDHFDVAGCNVADRSLFYQSIHTGIRR